MLHPLAKYPRPLRYKLSGWPLLWQAYRGNRHIRHNIDHEKCGPIGCIAPNSLPFSTSTALSTVYGSRNANVKKGEWYKIFDIEAGAYGSFTEVDRDRHAAKRRWQSRALSAECKRMNEALIIGFIENFCRIIQQSDNKWGKKWNIAEMTTYLGFDVIGGIVFGCDFHTIQTKEKRNPASSELPATPTIEDEAIRDHKPVADNNCLINYANDQVLSRGECESGISPSKQKDMLSRIIDHDDEKTGWRPTSTFTSADKIVNGPKLNSCTYTYTCIEETLRASGVPSHLPCVVLSDDITVDGYQIPAGTVVGVPTYLIHRNSQYFSHPWYFAPEHWIESGIFCHRDFGKSAEPYQISSCDITLDIS
ncbi:cytochrome P450 [Lojkania enalia]|uniref:Cytochrome P450 n=1 Tax=Lojkania enalia TaxID=147567 RepID=A0A9P4K5M6_9PLEO|nr:cytochrome P450 [Didymosphaeria enalia]